MSEQTAEQSESESESDTESGHETGVTDASGPVRVPDEDMIAETIVCQGYCDDEVLIDATVDVVAGATIGEWSTPQPHVGVTGIESDLPDVQKWCVSCANSRFQVRQSARDHRVEQASRYLTPAVVAAFVIGASLALLVSILIMI